VATTLTAANLHFINTNKVGRIVFELLHVGITKGQVGNDCLDEQ
jgi:hypothetical protein